MLLPMLLLLQDASPVAAAYAEYREKTRAVVSCRAPKDDEEVVVCAKREAYRYQTPFVSTNPQNDGHSQEAILDTAEAKGFVECGKGAFLVHCGSVGIGVTMGSSGEVRRAPPP